MNLIEFQRILNTIKYLKPKQVYYRGLYAYRKKFIKKTYNFEKNLSAQELSWQNSFFSPESYQGKHSFTFLNINHHFTEIDWNYSGYGKLWTYNLNYFDFLQQKGMTATMGLTLIRDYVNKSSKQKDGLEPYPISLRSINWIKFLSIYKIRDEQIDHFLYNDYRRLLDNLEYHILGNHLLENGFSLLFGSLYFNDPELLNAAKTILENELEEQILEDGAHFELSPMYHKIILTRLLDCIQLVQKNSMLDTKELMRLMEKKASLMLSFLAGISFNDKTIPLFNDAAYFIAASNEELFNYANKLGIEAKEGTLKGSGYRKITFNGFEVIADVGQIGPDYQPGHAHADTFNFCLHHYGIPIITDTGTSTYNIGERRDYERSTLAHNTVTYQGKNSSEVWGGFRVADRAKVSILKEDDKMILAEHDGFRKEGVIHCRKFGFSSNGFVIQDEMKGIVKQTSISSIHFHPSVTLEQKNDYILINDKLKLRYKGFTSITIKPYLNAPQFNKLEDAKKIEGVFERESSIIIENS